MTSNIANDKIIVIGAGAAGSYASYLLDKLGYNVTILEARDRVGGRTYSLDDVDIGGSWVSTWQPIVYNLCKEMQLTLIPQYEDGKAIYNLNNNKEVVDGDMSNYDNKTLEGFIAKFEKWAQQIDCDSSFYRDLDKINISDWLDKNVFDKSANQFLKRFISGVSSSAKENISMFFWLYFLKQGHGFACLAGNKDGAQEFRVKEGTQTLSKKLTENLNVLLNHQVVSVSQSENNQYQVTTATGKHFYASKVICAIPPNLINKISWSPNLESERIQIYQGMKMGCVTKFVIKYQNPIWRDHGYNGVCISDSIPSIVSFDGCTNDYNALIVFVPHIDNGFNNYADEEILTQLAQLFDLQELKNPLKIYRKDWYLDPFATGCYFCVPKIGDGHLYKYLTQNYNNIYFIGTETANDWYGYIEGALESAARVVAQISKNK